MRFLVDQNVPPSVAVALREAGHDAVHTRERGLERAEDHRLVELARAEERIVVNFDSDFSRILALSGTTHPLSFTYAWDPGTTRH